MTHRVRNFGAGPSALPLPVLERMRDELLDFDGTGMSILEGSHRAPAYDRVHQRAIDNLRALLTLPEEYEVLLMTGGARSQFAIVAMNLLRRDLRAQYLVTGRWSELALEEARKFGEAVEIWSSAERGFDSVPEPGDFQVERGAAYLHYTSNNTIYGTQYPYVPDSGDVPLVCDMCSDILSAPLDCSRFGVIYAGAQKNLGPAGVTIVIVRRDLLARSAEGLPDTMSYARMAAKRSLVNTPPVFSIYGVALVTDYWLERGGLEALAEHNRVKAERLYGAIDGSGGFYRGHARPEHRSKMNVTFRLPSEELEARFVTQAVTAGLAGLKGHRSVGGIRASIYNAAELEGVEELVGFMAEFQRNHG